MTPELRADAHYQLSLVINAAKATTTPLSPPRQTRNGFSAVPQAAVRAGAADIRPRGLHYATVSTRAFPAAGVSPLLPASLHQVAWPCSPGTPRRRYFLERWHQLYTLASSRGPGCRRCRRRFTFRFCEGSPMTTPAPAIADAKPNAGNLRGGRRTGKRWKGQRGSRSASMLLDKAGLSACCRCGRVGMKDCLRGARSQRRGLLPTAACR